MPDKIQIPEVIPVMVLPECALLPRALLPLYIFEPRYRDMLADSLATTRIFCIGTMQEPGSRESHLGAVHPYSTAGVIRACVGNPDGTSHLMLLGLHPIELVGWAENPDELAYEQAQVRKIEAPIENAEEATSLADQLFKAARELPSSVVPDENAKWEGALGDAHKDPKVLAEVVGCRILGETETQQAFLGATSTESRLSLLLGILRDG